MRVLCVSSRHHCDVQKRLHERLLDAEHVSLEPFRVKHDALLPFKIDSVRDVVADVGSVMGQLEPHLTLKLGYLSCLLPEFQSAPVPMFLL